MVRAHKAILEYFKLVHVVENYENELQDIPDPFEEQQSELIDHWGDIEKGEADPCCMGLTEDVPVVETDEHGDSV